MPIALLLPAYIGFVSLGLPDAVHGIAWPQVRATFGLSQSGLGFILASGGAGYLLSAFSTGRLLNLFRVGTLLGLSTGLVATGLFGYYATEAWALFLVCAFVIGAGSGAIDGALNAFASKNLSARHMAWLHGCYGVGASLGPWLMTEAVLTRTWRMGFLQLAVTMGLLTVAFVLTRKMWSAGDKFSAAATTSPVTLREALSSKPTLLLATTFFFYTGLEVTMAQWSYTFNTEVRGMDTRLAGMLSVGYWVSLTAGRFLMGYVVEKLGTGRVLNLSFAGAILAAALFTVPSETASLMALLLAGMSLASVYPLLMSETPRRVGARLADSAVGFQVSAAVVGVMVIPSIVGLVSENMGLWTIPFSALVLALILGVLHLAGRLR